MHETYEQEGLYERRYAPACVALRLLSSILFYVHNICFAFAQQRFQEIASGLITVERKATYAGQPERMGTFATPQALLIRGAARTAKCGHGILLIYLMVSWRSKATKATTTEARAVNFFAILRVL